MKCAYKQVARHEYHTHTEEDMFYLHLDEKMFDYY